jgi:hypothetical protein
MPKRERCASRTARAMSHTLAAMGANARQTRLRAARRRQRRRLTAWRKLMLRRRASQPRSRPVRARQKRLQTSTPRRPPKRAGREPQTRRRTAAAGTAQLQRLHPQAGRRKHSVRLVALLARLQLTAGLRKPSMMRHLPVLPALLPARRRFGVPAATADIKRFPRLRRPLRWFVSGCIAAASVITSSRLKHLILRG